MATSTPKLNLLPTALQRLLRNSFGCQSVRKKYSETRFAANMAVKTVLSVLEQLEQSWYTDSQRKGDAGEGA